MYKVGSESNGRKKYYFKNSGILGYFSAELPPKRRYFS
jgi:hypothetical protein